jgi:hypothetical protein
MIRQNREGGDQVNLKAILNLLSPVQSHQFLIESNWFEGAYWNQVKRISSDGILYPVAKDDWHNDYNAAGDILLLIDEITSFGCEVVIDVCPDVAEHIAAQLHEGG